MEELDSIIKHVSVTNSGFTELSELNTSDKKKFLQSAVDLLLNLDSKNSFSAIKKYVRVSSKEMIENFNTRLEVNPFDNDFFSNNEQFVLYEFFLKYIDDENCQDKEVLEGLDNVKTSLLPDLMAYKTSIEAKLFENVVNFVLKSKPEIERADLESFMKVCDSYRFADSDLKPPQLFELVAKAFLVVNLTKNGSLNEIVS